MTEKDKEILKAYSFGYNVEQIAKVEEATILYIKDLIKEATTSKNSESYKFLSNLRGRSYD